MRLLLLLLSLATEPTTIDCQAVKQNYAQWRWVGKPAIRAWLKVNGYSSEQVREAERCLTDNKGH